jgi:hypothetical protein
MDMKILQTLTGESNELALIAHPEGSIVLT